MSDICFYSGLPYSCDLCTETKAPCAYMNTRNESIRISNEFLDLYLKSAGSKLSPDHKRYVELGDLIFNNPKILYWFSKVLDERNEILKRYGDFKK